MGIIPEPERPRRRHEGVLLLLGFGAWDVRAWKGAKRPVRREMPCVKPHNSDLVVVVEDASRPSWALCWSGTFSDDGGPEEALSAHGVGGCGRLRQENWLVTRNDGFRAA
jgi:hypothetical protein